MHGQTRGRTQRSTHTLLVVRILAARILAFSATEAEFKKKKKNKDRVWRKQTGDFNSQPWKWGTQQATLRELWPRLREESRGSCETRAPRQDPGTENKGVGVLGSSLLHCFRTSRSLALVTQ